MNNEYRMRTNGIINEFIGNNNFRLVTTKVYFTQVGKNWRKNSQRCLLLPSRTEVKIGLKRKPKKKLRKKAKERSIKLTRGLKLELELIAEDVYLLNTGHDIVYDDSLVNSVRDHRDQIVAIYRYFEELLSRIAPSM